MPSCEEASHCLALNSQHAAQRSSAAAARSDVPRGHNPTPRLDAAARHSSGSRLPNQKCCMMGNLDSTSTWYILIMPALTLAQLGTLLTSSSMGLVSCSEPFLTWVCWHGKQEISTVCVRQAGDALMHTPTRSCNRQARMHTKTRTNCTHTRSTHTQCGAPHRLHKLDGREVHVLLAVRVQQLFVVDRLGLEQRLAGHLARAPHKGQELIVIQSPHAVRAGGLQPVGRLDAAHEAQVPERRKEAAGGGAERLRARACLRVVV